jgi:hypothetical protein
MKVFILATIFVLIFSALVFPNVHANKPPSVNAGPDESVLEGQTFTFKATASDMDKDKLTFTWIVTYSEVLGVNLSNPNALNPTFTAPQVDADKKVTFKLTASDGSSSNSDTVEITIKNKVSVPTAPQNLHLLPVPLQGHVDLGWDPPASDGGSPITSYRVERKGPESANWISYASTTTHIIIPVQPSSSYQFRAYAKNAIGESGPSNTFGLTTQPPQNPMSLSISDVSISEGTSSSYTVAQVPITLSNPVSSGGLQISVATIPVTATSSGNPDYVKIESLMTIPQGAYEFKILLRIVADSNPEPDETLKILLTSTQAEIADGEAIITIRNDDQTPATQTGSTSMAPIVDAGQDDYVYEGESYTLDGSATDPDSTNLTYTWTMDNDARKLGITLIHTDTQNPIFTAPLVDTDETVRFTLRVSDGTNVGTSIVTITILDTVDSSIPEGGDLAGSVSQGTSATCDPQSGHTIELTVPDDYEIEAEYEDGSYDLYIMDVDIYACNVDGNQVTIECFPPSESLFEIGDTIVTCTATTDDDEVEESFTITVLEYDTRGSPKPPRTPSSPTISSGSEECDPEPGHSIQLEVPDDYETEADYDDGTYLEYPTEACDVEGNEVTIECVPPSESLFEIGDTIVTCTATTDDDEVEESFTITVLEPSTGGLDSFDDQTTPDSGNQPFGDEPSEDGDESSSRENESLDESSEISIRTLQSPQPGIIDISGVVENGQPNQEITFEVQDVTGKTVALRTVLLDSNGEFSLVFEIPESAGTTFTISASTEVDGEEITKTKTITVGKTASGGGCLIATATYGSEMSDQVQLLRELRDSTLLSTNSGSSFMTAFNGFYYFFSPTIADLERQNPIFKELIRTAITPMLSTLSILNYVNIDSEQEMLGYGIGIILLNVGLYFVAPAILLVKIRKLL